MAVESVLQHGHTVQTPEHYSIPLFSTDPELT